MSLLTEGKNINDVVLWEEEREFSREKITVASGQGAVVIGQVLEASGDEFIKLATEANASAVALQACDATSSAREIVAIRREAVLKQEGLNYNSQTVATTNAALKGRGMVVRTSPTYTTL